MPNIPPNNIEAEKSILGSIIMGNTEALENAFDNLKIEDFYLPANQDIFQAITELHTSRNKIDFVTITDLLKKKNKLDIIGGATYITELLEIVPTGDNYSEYIKIVAEKSILRQLINASTKISTMAFNDSEDTEEILERSERLIYNISDKETKADFQDIKNLLMETYNWIETRSHNKGNTLGLKTGFNELDTLTGGLQKGELIILAARPSMGKTALALNIALNSALNNAVVAIFSLEMGAESLTQRLVASKAQADMQTFKKGKFDQGLLDEIVKASSEIHQTDIYINDSTIISPINMLSKARKLKSEKGRLDLIVVDYLQMVKPPKDVRDNRVLEVSMISRGLKNLAREMNCPVICLSQLTRDVEKRPDKRPMLSDLRESGSIEADADIVMMLYRPKYYEKKEIISSDEVVDDAIDMDEEETCELIIAKHRNGPTGTINLKFISKYVSFYSIDTYHEE